MTWEIKDCVGKLILTNKKEVNTVDIAFEVSCHMDGTIDVRVMPLQWQQEMSWLVDLMHESDFSPHRLSLTGQTPEGNHVTSTSVYLLQATPQQNGKEVILPIKLSCYELLFSISDFEQGVTDTSSGLIKYDLPGFQCFGCVSTIAAVGKIKAVGSANIDDYDRISGAVTVETIKVGRLNEWEKRVDERVEMILDIFSLAGGRYIEWSRRSLFCGDKWIKTLFKSLANRGKPSQPVFHYLNMQPIFELAVHKYNNKTKENTGFGIALEQFLIPSLYVESQFTTCFMALEHLVNSHAIFHKQGEILPAKKFDKFVKPEIKAGLNCALDSMKACLEFNEMEIKSCEEAIESMKEKIIELNRYSFAKKMSKFIDDINVPIENLSMEEIKKLIPTRNSIIHSGAILPKSPYFGERQQRLALLRELLTRIFLTLLGYEGEYSSYCHGHQYIHFPTMKKR